MTTQEKNGQIVSNVQIKENNEQMQRHLVNQAHKSRMKYQSLLLVQIILKILQKNYFES